MRLTIADVLQFPSSEEARLIIGGDKLNSKVTGAIVMEALDIRGWGQHGQLLLTSYFAFKDSTEEDKDLFFEQAKEIGIAGFIFKTDRLVKEIPAGFIAKCIEYDFPLIQIPGHINYDTIIQSVLEAVNNQKAFRFETYYQNHLKFIQLMMSQADLMQILLTLESLISKPITLAENVDQEYLSTNEKLEEFEIVSKAKKREYINSYVRAKIFKVKYAHSKKFENMLSVPIPTLGYEDYELLIHHANDSLGDIELTAIENAIIALQTELVKKYAIRQNNLLHLNEMTTKLVTGSLTTKEEVKETIQNLEMSVSDDYRVVIFDFKDVHKNQSVADWNRLTDKLIYLAKNNFLKMAFVQQSSKVVFILPILDFSLNEMKKLLTDILKRINSDESLRKLLIHVTISNEVSAYLLPQAYKQALNTLLVVDLIETDSPIVAYEDIGIFQLFIETDNLDSIKKFIPEQIQELHAENPELLNTLYTFINTNQKYSETAEILYVHPKTVRYRVNQLETQYDIDLKDPEKVLFYNIALRLIKYFERNEKQIVGE